MCNFHKGEVVLKGVWGALGGLGYVGVFWGCWGSFKWRLGCFEGGVGAVWVFWGILRYNHSC